MLALIGFVGLCLLVGAADGAITAGAIAKWYVGLAKPPGTPPNWVFAPVWTTLYVLMGTAAWLVWQRGQAKSGPGNRHRRVLLLWGWQLLANSLWTPAFFGLNSALAGLVVIAALLALVVVTMLRFWPISRPAAVMMVPYAAWVAYATYLNAGIFVLNG